MLPNRLRCKLGLLRPLASQLLGLSSFVVTHCSFATSQVFFWMSPPTNSAFSKIDSKVLSSLLEPASKGALANILTYHVVSGQLNAADVVKALNDGGGKVVVKALNNQSLTVMQKDGNIWLMDSNGTYSEIVATDVMGSNGVIHVIDTVVMPE